MNNVLIVDDEKYVRLGLKTLIERSGYCTGEIIECKNGEEALKVIGEKNFDVIFSDIKMPIMDGILFIDAIYQNKLSDAFLIIISGYDDFNYAVESMRRGAIEYLLKPVDRIIFSNVLDKIESRLKQKKDKDTIKITILDNNESKLQKIDRAIYYINEHFNDPNLNMAVVSNEISMNYTFFSETFKEAIGKSFVDYIKYVRISMAKKILKSTNIKVASVAKEVGYSNIKHFLKLFKLETGLTPSDYRKNYIELANKNKEDGV